MAYEAVKPEIRELVGVACQASRLVIDAKREETPLLRIAAMGAAARQIARNVDAPTSKPASARDAIEARLAPLLWRIKYGRDGSQARVLEAVMLFSVWMYGTRTWRESPPPADLAQRFAVRVLHEWLHDRCPACGGTGLQELRQNGVTRKPQRFNDRSVRHVQCRICSGSTLKRPSSGERAKTLDLPLDEIRSTWDVRLDRAAASLRAIARRLKRPLRFELEKRTTLA